MYIQEAAAQQAGHSADALATPSAIAYRIRSCSILSPNKVILLGSLKMVYGFFKADAVLVHVRGSFRFVPFELQIHTPTRPDLLHYRV